jgi:hypothetical protein
MEGKDSEKILNCLIEKQKLNDDLLNFQKKYEQEYQDLLSDDTFISQFLEYKIQEQEKAVKEMEIKKKKKQDELIKELKEIDASIENAKSVLNDMKTLKNKRMKK